VSGQLCAGLAVGALLLPQAGLAALLATTTLVDAGQQWRGLLVAVVLVNAIVTPPLLTRALRAASGGVGPASARAS
jgi:hypothetical protein